MVPTSKTTLASHLPPFLPILPFTTRRFSKSNIVRRNHFYPSPPLPLLESPYKPPLRCSLSVASEPTPTHLEFTDNQLKPSPAEVSRTIMELSSVATLSTLSQDSWPFGVGVRFAVDSRGTPILCLNTQFPLFHGENKSSLHVQLEQCGLRTPQCTIQGSLDKPKDEVLLKKLHSTWKTRFGEEVNEELIYVVNVERVFQMEDFSEEGVWFTSSDYKMANPDPLRDFAERIVDEINTHNTEDVDRFCNIYVDLDFQVSEAKMVWVDRLGFDMRLRCLQNDIFEVRIPFPREVTDEKGVKSSFNGMAQLAWEVEKNYLAPDFKKVKQLKKITSRGR